MSKNVVKLIEVENGSSEDMSFHEGRISGRNIGKLFGKLRGEFGYAFDKYNDGFWQLLADRLAVGTADDEGLEGSIERGKALEAEALEKAREVLGLKLKTGYIWQAQDRHLATPDGFTDDMKVVVEIKCLKSSNHIKAIVTDTPPQEYMPQIFNYFAANPLLEKVYMLLYDNRFDVIPELQCHYWEFKREDYGHEIAMIEDCVAEALSQVNDKIKLLVERYGDR